METPDFLAIVGATASGKTALSLGVGRRLGCEVVSMDSRQVYRGMDVGTGKVTLRERALLPHHGLDLLDPHERYSAGRFARDARQWIEGIRGRGRVPLLVGGTGFFLRALIEPMFPEPELDGDRLDKLRLFLNGLSIEELLRFVRVLDPQRAEMAADGGKQRLTRTVEMALLTGRPLSAWHSEGGSAGAPLSCIVFLLDLPRELLYERINQRVTRMMEEGFPEEVRSLLKAGYLPQDPGMTGSGYREMVRFLEGELTREDVVDEIQRSHRRYARRQKTWYRHQLPPQAVVLDGTKDTESLVEEVVEKWKAVLGFPEGVVPEAYP
jgi:tRNA dimethylallyltransferase